MSDNREFIEEFLVEAVENLDQLDRDLIALEVHPDDPQRLASIFRTVHTIKGNSGFFGFSKLGALAHSGEHLLGRLRDGKITLNGRVTGSLLSMVDAVRSIIQTIESTGTEGDADFRQLSSTIVAVATEDGGPELTEPEVPMSQAAVPFVTVAPEVASDQPVVELAAPAPAESAPPVPVAAKTPAAPTETSVRVDLSLLASILDLVSELVLARNQLRGIESTDPAFQGVSQRINSVTNALQETAVKTRMQPINYVFSKFPRTVRDLAVSCGKEVQFVVDGADTELDRSLIEGIRDPLTHLIRNAVDHGIELPEERQSKGKSRAGQLLLRAFHESGQVTIEVADDGGGIPVEAVRQKAVARGLVTAESAATLSDEDILQFIFEPGFSTAAKVTAVSGRGVGMDVVKTNIEAIGGTVDIHSLPGQGTTVRVRVPLTLAIIPAVIATCAGERFAIPQAYVSELVSLRENATGPRIEGLNSAPVIRIRGRLLPVIFLDQWLGLVPPVDRSAAGPPKSGTVILVRVDDHEFGLVVDGMRSDNAAQRHKPLLESASLSTIVVKPIGGLLAQMGLYSGATVMGDGGVVLILDLRGLLRAADLPPARRESAGNPVVEAAADRLTFARYLVCQTHAGRRIAVPLSDIARLEHFNPEHLEKVGPRCVVRRGEIFTAVVDADEILGVPPRPALTDAVNLIVLSEQRGSIGLAVKRILDVVEAESPLQPTLASQGVVGSLALGGCATEVLDLRAL